MLIKVKLYGHLVCMNKDLSFYEKKKFEVKLPEGALIKDLHKLLGFDTSINYVNLVNGKAEKEDFLLTKNSEVSIFPPMGKRTHDLFNSINKKEG